MAEQEDYKEKYEALKMQLNFIKGTAPENNTDFLINQVTCGNIKTNDNKRVLNILGHINNAIKDMKNNLSAKNTELIKLKKKK